jgi:hypothetical protein
MLDVIADFWKPVKKSAAPEKLQPDQLQIGSSLGFGFVPQTLLSGRRLHVSAINTYQFGDEALTSFVLTQDKDPGVSMIIAESEGEHYLAISRRISINDRMRLFETQELDNIMSKADITRLACRDNIVDFKGWVVPSYKREIQGLKGRIFKGDYRKAPLPANNEAQDFEYTLLVSDSNEHAIEIEKYTDGRVEVYATVYRRMGDIGEITHPENMRPDVQLASSIPDKTPVTTSAPVISSAPSNGVAEPVKPEPIKLPEFEAEMKLETTPAEAAAPVPELPPAPKEVVTPISTTIETKTTRNDDMNTAEALKPKLFVQPNNEAYGTQEIKAVNGSAKTNFENDAIECDLRVANKIIDEAIRNEMRLTDIVRRIIELPVAFPESVQIPMTLTDEDYALLAIRYSISSSDRNAIKRRIIEDLNDFSGGKKKAA